MQNNKIGKYFKYAIGEIFLVVIGILIALQINNLNNKTIESEREIKYLKSIKIDLKKDIQSLDVNIAFRQKKSLGIEEIIKQINGQPIQDLEKTAINVVSTLYQENFRPSNVTYNDLVSSGNMNLISDDSIKMYLFDLSLLYQSNAYNNEHETSEYAENVSKSIFGLIDLEQLKPVFLGVKTAEQMQLSAANFTALFESQKYKNGCVVLNWTSEEFVETYEFIKIKSLRLIELIDLRLESE
jgi:hypothetical protein